MNKRPDFFDELSEELTLKLGQAVWAFTKIESLTYEYIHNIGGEIVFKLMKSQNFGSRVQVLKVLVAQRTDDPDEIVSLLDDAIKLAAQRNTIVHNPWSTYISFDGELVSEIQKYTNPNDKFTPEQLVDFSIRAQTLEEKLRNALRPIDENFYHIGLSPGNR